MLAISKDTTYLEIFDELGGEKAAYAKYFDDELDPEMREVFVEKCYSPNTACLYMMMRVCERLEIIAGRLERIN